MQHNEWQTPGRMFRLLGRVGEVIIQWRAVDADNERYFRWGNGGRAQLRAIFHDWPVLAPVELFVSASADSVSLEQHDDGHVLVTFSTGESIRVPNPVPSAKLKELR